jgi:hypothetical protein
MKLQSRSNNRASHRLDRRGVYNVCDIDLKKKPFKVWEVSIPIQQESQPLAAQRRKQQTAQAEQLAVDKGFPFPTIHSVSQLAVGANTIYIRERNLNTGDYGHR